MEKIIDALRAMGRVYGREIRNIFHDAGVMLFMFFLPLAYPVIYSLIYNPELVRDVPVVVVDSDRTPLSREFVRRFDATEGARITGYAANLEEGKRAVASRQAYAILEIPSGFESKIGRGEQGPAVMYCEMSLLLRYRALLYSMTPLQQAMGAELLAGDISSLGAESLAATTDPMPIEAVDLGNLQGGFDSFIMPGVLIIILQQCIILAVGMMGGARREKPLLTGYDAANTCPSVVGTILAKTGAYLTLMAVPLLFLVHYVPIIFAFPMAGSTWQIFAFLVPMALCSYMLGFIVQAFVTERESIFIVWVGTTIMVLFLSGLTWPRYAMPQVWGWISDLIPCTWGLNGFILMNANGASLSDVQSQWEHLWILLAVYGAIALCVQHYFMPRRR